MSYNKDLSLLKITLFRGLYILHDGIHMVENFHFETEFHFDSKNYTIVTYMKIKLISNCSAVFYFKQFHKRSPM